MDNISSLQILLLQGFQHEYRNFKEKKTMLDKDNIRLKSEYSIIAHDPNTVELRAGVWNPKSITMTDENHNDSLLPILLGIQQGNDSQQIAKDCDVNRSEVESVVDSLLEAGLVCENQSGALNDLVERQLSMRMRTDTSSEDIILVGDSSIVSLLRQQLVSAFPDKTVKDVSGSPEEEKLLHIQDDDLTDGLEREKISSVFSAWGNALVVCAFENSNPLLFRHLDVISEVVGFNWIHGTVDGPYIFIGPTIIPRRSATYRDLEKRVMLNLQELASYQKFKTALAMDRVHNQKNILSPPLVGLLASFLALEVINWIQAGANYTVNKVLGIYLPTMEIAYHEVLPIPGSEGSGAEPDRDMETLYFDPREWLGTDNLESR